MYSKFFFSIHLLFLLLKITDFNEIGCFLRFSRICRDPVTGTSKTETSNFPNQICFAIQETFQKGFIFKMVSERDSVFMIWFC